MATAKKVVQTEVDIVLYDFVLKTAKSKGLTLKEAAREALRAWAAQEGDLSWDPLFDPSWGFGVVRGAHAAGAVAGLGCWLLQEWWVARGKREG